MDHCCAMLKEQFPEVDGLQRMSVFESIGGQRIGTPVGKFIQILLVGSHWVMVSNIDCTADQVRVYDSIYRRTPKPYRNKFVAQIAWLCHVSEAFFELQWPDLQTQKGNKDCGLFAIANAVALCCGQKPEECAWDQPKMRKHLTNCIESDNLTMFPLLQTGTRRHKAIINTERVEVFCTCRQPNDRNLPMAECETCKEWYHKKCEAMPWPIRKGTTFVCRRCQK